MATLLEIYENENYYRNIRQRRFEPTQGRSNNYKQKNMDRERKPQFNYVRSNYRTNEREVTRRYYQGRGSFDSNYHNQNANRNFNNTNNNQERSYPCKSRSQGNDRRGNNNYFRRDDRETTFNNSPQNIHNSNNNSHSNNDDGTNVMNHDESLNGRWQ